MAQANAQPSKDDDEVAKLRRQLAEKTAELETAKANALAGIDEPLMAGTEEIDDGMATVINVSSQTVTFNIGNGRRVTLKPKQHTVIEKLYAYPQTGASKNGDPIPAVIEQLTDGRVVPWDHKKAAPYQSRFQDTAALREKNERIKRLQQEERASRRG